MRLGIDGLKRPDVDFGKPRARSGVWGTERVEDQGSQNRVHSGIAQPPDDLDRKRAEVVPNGGS